ncbi:hypothetical protein Bca52824_087847 [Brassica carinata]|uniref:Uncharacterized protein n=1 Tax=Brassica carinata TaxID=52824 RepID=A0A8X7TNN9_BRACI|nr:hypothetical protein Bca52824_087847 [Brassica carinata]
MANQTAVATVQYKPFSTFVSAGPGDSKLMFRLIHFWEACNNSKGGILIGTKYVTVDFFNDHHPHRLSHVPFPTTFLEFPAGKFYRKFSETCSRMVISQKDMIAYHEHAGEASNSHPPMLDAVSNEFWEQKICFVIDDDQEPLISQFKIGDETYSSNIFNFGLFILEMITNLKPGEEQEDPERKYVE